MKVKRYTHQEVKENIAEEGYSLLSTEYVNTRKKLYMMCPKGHDCHISWFNFNKSSQRCPICTKERVARNKRKRSIDDIKSYIANEPLYEGYEVLSTEYKRYHDKLHLKCPCGRDHWITWAKIRENRRCRKCSMRKLAVSQKKDFNEIKEYIEKEGYTLLSTEDEYKNNRTKLKLSCPEKKQYTTTWERFKNGTRCRSCTNLKEAEKRYKEIQMRMLAEGYALLTKYEDAHQKILIKCPKGHVYQSCWNYFQRGHRCSVCFPYSSRAEQEIQKRYSCMNLSANDRKQIKPLELDLYFPDKQVAIEYCGLYWHSEAAPGDRISSSYHRNKMNVCNKKDIRLLTIFEDEWLNHKDICVSRINNVLGICDQRIFARKCIVREISKKEAKEFLNRAHLQGCGKSKVAYGLFYNDILMQVMTFGSPARAHTTKGKRVLEMKRFAGELNVLIVGGAGKLFKLGLQYAKENNYEIIKSYCDLRWGTGNLYEQLGFTKTYETNYTPHYTDFVNRYRNQKLATNKKKEGKTEKDKAKEKKLYKIYDCGHSTWEYFIK